MFTPLICLRCLNYLTRKSVPSDLVLRPWPDLWPPPADMSVQVIRLIPDGHIIKAPRINWTGTVTCGDASVSVPEPALLSPSTVLIKASGGRREGWTEQEEEETRMCDSQIYVTEKGEGWLSETWGVTLSSSRLCSCSWGLPFGTRHLNTRTKKAWLKNLKRNLKRKQMPCGE